MRGCGKWGVVLVFILLSEDMFLRYVLWVLKVDRLDSCQQVLGRTD